MCEFETDPISGAKEHFSSFMGMFLILYMFDIYINLLEEVSWFSQTLMHIYFELICIIVGSNC